MANGKEVNHILRRIKSVDDPVITDTQTISIATGQMIMWEFGKAKTHIIDFAFNSSANAYRKSEESGIKTSIINLQRRAHANSRFACARTDTGAHLTLRFADVGL